MTQDVYIDQKSLNPVVAVSLWRRRRPNASLANAVGGSIGSGDQRRCSQGVSRDGDQCRGRSCLSCAYAIREALNTYSSACLGTDSGARSVA